MVICDKCQNASPSNLKGFVNCKYKPRWEYQSKEFNRDCDKFQVKCAMNTTDILKTTKVNTISKPLNILSNQFNPFLCK